MENLIEVSNRTFRPGELRLPLSFNNASSNQRVSKSGEVDTSTPHFIEGCIRILKAMLVEDFMPYDQIVNHLDYLIHILILLKKYNLNKVTKYDEAYRTEQFNEGHPWGVEKTLLESLFFNEQTTVELVKHNDDLLPPESDFIIIGDKIIIKEEVLDVYTEVFLDTAQPQISDHLFVKSENEMVLNEDHKQDDMVSAKAESDKSNILLLDYKDENQEYEDIGKMDTQEEMLECSACGEKFSQQTDLISHISTHAKGKAYFCKYCTKGFVCESKLIAHERRHNGLKRHKQYTCKVCVKPFPSSKALKQHEKIVKHSGTMEKTHICHVCGKKCNSSSALSDHLRIHTGEKPYQCRYCDKAFRQSSQRKRHERIHTGEKPYKCELCDQAFNDSSTLKKHMFVHTGERPFQCTICDKKFSFSQVLKKHMDIHSGASCDTVMKKQSNNRKAGKQNKHHKCKDCTKHFASAKALKLHEKRSCGRKRIYMCHVCGKRSNSASGLRDHSRIHTGEKPYQCSYCNKSFRQSSQRKRHERIHTGEKPYKCELCDQAFSDASTLKNHMFVHTGEKPFQCTICDYKFSFSGTLKKHMEVHTVTSVTETSTKKPSTHQKGGLSYICKICSQKFEYPRKLTEHMQESHTDSKLRSCTECNKTFATETGLLAHAAKHVGQKKKRFICQVCGKTCPTKSAFVEHSRIHTGEELFKCSYCDKSFTQAAAKVYHERTHTKEKPYKCEVCDQAFSDSSTLKKHMATHTGEMSYHCNICDLSFHYSHLLNKHMKSHIVELEDTEN